jgi:hypothetical protein
MATQIVLEFGGYITPEEAKKKGDTRTIAELNSAFRSRGKCQCGQPIWRFGGCGLCFTCTTGEADPSEDYEFVTA